MTPWRGQIVVDTGVILYVGPGAAAATHAHHAVQLVWSDEPFVIEAHGARHERRAVLVPANVAHALECRSGIALLLVEAHGDRGRALDARAHHEMFAELALPAALLPRDLSDVTAWTEQVFAALGVPAPQRPMSAATRRAVAYIEGHLAGVPRVSDAARELGLSTSRLTHVFSREVGLPFRRFVLWSRIKHAMAAYRVTPDLTRAAVEAGFSDGAHLSRTFRQMFGLSPSLVGEALRGAGSAYPR